MRMQIGCGCNHIRTSRIGSGGDTKYADAIGCGYNNTSILMIGLGAATKYADAGRKRIQ